jgi:hypothetical protein
MNVSRKTKLLGFFAAVVAVSVATNLATNYISSKSNNDYTFPIFKTGFYVRFCCAH